MHAPENADAIEGCLMAACKGLDLSVAELWRRENRSGLHFLCLHVTASPSALESYSSYLLGKAAQARKHSLSPQLCEKGLRQKVPLWYTAAEPDAAIHATIPIKTAIVLPTFSYEIQQEFYVLFFSFKRLTPSSSTISFLRYLSKATVVACGASLVKSIVDAVHAPALSQEKLNEVSVVCAKPELPNMFVQWTDLHHVERLVDGGTSVVYTATYNRLPVIVKILKEDCERNELRLREIRGEIELMQSLNHPNIVQYIASGWEPRTFVVMERLEGGSLNQRLGFAPTHSGVHRNNFFTRDVRKAFSYESLLKYALQMAEALKYMHDEALPGYAVMHRDLKPDNVGFKADGTLKILDFGLAKAIPKDETARQKVRMTGETGSIRYMAPEVALHKQYNQKADIFSWSFIVWEMATLTKPFEGYTKHDFFTNVVKGGERPPLNKRWPKEFAELLQACWDTNQNKRPEMAEVCEALKVLLAGVEERSKKARFFLLMDRRSTWF
ncbi:hypothetical protein NSK_000241 [Nannochloropsis salina CCMP1776]|uniref:Protein kinase domain-containing protein n=1 Tax=Nannochloropsis salina CCMP1776 TaxID=1027361 RepID=A0A4D9DAK6_9STRA|nr:hypothetical protein NSK_000241 [Nannochloropsis salina CCMP1776]|eukprot:TFJ88672.1 hypothetical protein NSK_000241 [Nannochloropsis salina CCMP1776]